MTRRRRRQADVGAAALALLALVRGRLVNEWVTTPIYAASLGRRPVTGLAAGARDFRPVDLDLGGDLLKGRIRLAGQTLLLADGAETWEARNPSRAFAVELHRFAWLPSLIGQGVAGETEALRLCLDWIRAFERISPFVWSPETLERRVFNLACAAPKLTQRASDLEAGRLLTSLARQAGHLLRAADGPLRAIERTATGALAGVVLAGPRGERLMIKGLRALDRNLAVGLMPDGGLRSRNPDQALELLFDLLTLDDALLARGLEAPLSLSRAIDRLTQSVRFFTLGDGRLSAFHGGSAAPAQSVGAATAHDDAEGPVYGSLPYSAYQRMNGRALTVMVDAGPPAAGAWSLSACAQPLALEITGGPDRLVTNAGWTPDGAAAQAFRLTPAGSTAAVDGASSGRVLGGLAAKALGPRLVDAAAHVDVRRNENERGVWIELSHDGWAERFGLVHARRLFLDPDRDELRGEDRFEPVDGAAPRRTRTSSYTVHFHLPGEVQASLARDRRSILLRGPSNRGWWLRNDAPDVLLEPCTYFQDHAAHRGVQVILRGPINADHGGRVRWKLTPVEPGDHRAPSRSAGVNATPLLSTVIS